MTIDNSDRPLDASLDVFPGVNTLVPRVRRLIAAFSTIIIIAYGFLQWKNLPIVEILDTANPIHSLQAILFILFLSWVTGINLDVGAQAVVYVRTRREPQVTRTTITVVLIHLVSAAFLLWARKSTQNFAMGITVFSIASIALMIVSNRTIRPILERSRSVYRAYDENFGVQQTNILEAYLLGRWVWARVAVLLILLAALDSICLSEHTQIVISWFIVGFIDETFGRAVTPWLPLLAIAVFLAIAEGWQWIMRLQAVAAVHALGSLRDRFELRSLKK